VGQISRGKLGQVSDGIKSITELLEAVEQFFRNLDCHLADVRSIIGNPE